MLPLNFNQLINDRYQPVKWLGRGSMGQVLLAQDTHVKNRNVALKFINPELLTSDKSSIEKLQREVERLVKFERHPNVVQILDFPRVTDDIPFFVMSYIPGGSLQNRLDAGIWPDFEERERLISDLINALSFMHAHGIIHRDFKPANILIDSPDDQGYGQAFVSDFGISILAGQLDGFGGGTGTPGYRSPEQLKGNVIITERVDQYALAVIAWQLFTHQTLPPDPNKFLPEDIPDELRETILRALSESSVDRFNSVSEFGDALFMAPAPPVNSPYKGLQAYDHDDDGIFFGRSTVLDEIKQGLENSQFWSVVGPSGSGKSSLVRAGLVSAYKDMGLDWGITTPGIDPLFSLAFMIEENEKSAQRLVKLMRNSPIALGERLLGKPLLLVIDQLEQLLGPEIPAQDQKAFCDNLILAISRPGSKLKVVVTLRADFYDQFSNVSVAGLRQQIASHQTLLGEMSENELLEVIEKPAHQCHLYFSDGFQEKIISDVIDQPGALPLLSQALFETWRARRGRQLTLQDYKRLGGVHQVIERLAEKTYQELPTDAHRSVVRRIMLRLVQFNSGRPDTRRQQTEHDLQISQENPVIFEDVLQKLSTQRLITISINKGEAIRRIDLAHEVLINKWDRLKQWIKDLRENEQSRRVLQIKLSEWVRLGRKNGGLLDEQELNEFTQWLASPETQQIGYDQELFAFANHSRSALDVSRRREGKRRKFTIRAISIALVVTFVFAIFAWLQRNNAIRQAEISESLNLASYAESAYATNDIDLALALAIEAMKLQDPPFQTKATLGKIISAPGVIHTYGGSSEVASDFIFDFSYSPDDNFFVVSYYNGKISVWDTASGKINFNLEHLDVNSLQLSSILITISPDSKTIYTASQEKIRVWDSVTGKLNYEIPLLLKNETKITEMVVSPDGDKLALGTSKGEIGFLDLTSAENDLYAEFEHNSPIKSIAFSPNGEFIISIASDSLIAQTDVETGNLIKTFVSKNAKEVSISSVEISNSGNLILGNSDAGNLFIWDSGSGDLVNIITYDSIGMSNLSISPDDRWVSFGDQKGDIRIISLESGQIIYTLKGERFEITKLSFNSSGSRLISANKNGAINLWSLQTNPNKTLKGHTKAVVSLQFINNGNQIMSSSFDGSIRFWDIQSNKESYKIKNLDNQYIDDAAIDDSGEQIIYSSAWDGIILYDIKNQKVKATFYDNRENYGLGFIPNTPFAYVISSAKFGRQMGAASESMIRILDTNSFEETARIFTPGNIDTITSVAISPNGKQIAFVGLRNLAWHDQGNDRIAELALMEVWDLSTLERLHLLKIPDNIAQPYGVEFNPSGNSLLISSSTGFYIFNSNTGLLEKSYLLARTDIAGIEVEDIAFVNDASFIVAYSNGIIKLYDVQTGLEISSFLVGERVTRLVVHPDSNLFAAGLISGEIKLFALLPPQEMVKWAYEHRKIYNFSCEERNKYSIKPFCDKNGNLSIQNSQSTVLYRDPLLVETAELSALKASSLESLNNLISNLSTDITPYNFSGTNELTEDPFEIWSFHADAGEIISIIVESETFDPYLVLKNDEGRVLAINDDLAPVGSNSAGILYFRVTESGEYYIFIDQFLATDELLDKEYKFYLHFYSSLPVDFQFKRVNPGQFHLAYTNPMNQSFITIPMVTVNGPAYMSGIRAGDKIYSINGIDLKHNFRNIVNEFRCVEGMSLNLEVEHEGMRVHIPLTCGLHLENEKKETVKIDLFPGEKILSSMFLYNYSWSFYAEKETFFSFILGGGYRSPSFNIEVKSSNGDVIAEAENIHDSINTFGIGTLLRGEHTVIPLVKIPETGNYTVTVEKKYEGAENLYTVMMQELNNKGELRTEENKGLLSPKIGNVWSVTGKKGETIVLSFKTKNSLVEPILFILDKRYEILAFSGIDGTLNPIIESDAEIRVINLEITFPDDGTYFLVEIPFLRFDPVLDQYNGEYEILITKK